jgi:hypothetical protein
MGNVQDRAILRELAARTAEIAALPVQEEKRRLWRALNRLAPVRPMVAIDQVCWNEMDIDGTLAVRCADPALRAYEERLRRILFQWEHFPVDMVVEPTLDVPMAITNSGFGIDADEVTVALDPTNDVVSHHFNNQLQLDSDIEKLRVPRITHDSAETERRLAMAHDVFDDLLQVRPWGADPYLSVWDPISMWMGVEGALFALMDRPAFMHALVGRMTDGYMSMIDQLEEQGLLCQPQSLIHCTGAYVAELPAPGYDPLRPRAKDIWMFGLAQMLAAVSPAMFREFEVDYVSRICARFGLVYYGCCDPLDAKMNEVRMIPNVRKVSMSPWVDQERGAAEIGSRYVFSRKPNPAFLATTSFDPAMVKADLQKSCAICRRSGSSLELILKDISTVHRQPERLFQWARIAMEVVQS